MCRFVFGKNAVKDFGPIGGATAGQRIGAGGIAIGRSVRAQANQINRDRLPSRRNREGTGSGCDLDRTRDIRPSRGWTSDIGHVQGLSGLETELILIVFGEGSTRLSNGNQIQASLRVGRILIVNREQAVPLRADVAHLEKDVARQFTLYGKILLR